MTVGILHDTATLIGQSLPGGTDDTGAPVVTRSIIGDYPCNVTYRWQNQQSTERLDNRQVTVTIAVFAFQPDAPIGDAEWVRYRGRDHRIVTATQPVNRRRRADHWFVTCDVPDGWNPLPGDPANPQTVGGV